MLLTHTLRKLAAVSALPALLLMTSCGDDAKPLASTPRPTIDRLTPADWPVVPEGSVACAHDPARRCLTDEEDAQLKRGLADTITADEDIICWLRDWFGYPPCPSAD